MHAREWDRPDVARRRSGWRRWLQRLMDGRHMAFIDETWIKTTMTRLGGWSRLGQRLLGKVPHGHWKTLTLVAAPRHDGIVAPCVRPGDIVVLDNLGSHKGGGVWEAILAAGSRLVLQPRPQSNRAGLLQDQDAFAQAGRTLEATWRSVGDVLGRFTPDECRNYIANSGYQST